MSDSEEIERSSSGNEATSRSESDYTVDDSGESETDDNGATSPSVKQCTVEESESSEADDNIVRQRVVRKKKLVIIDTDTSEDEEERALSPRTRMSITGIRPQDLSDTSSEIDYDKEDNEEEKQQSDRSPCNESESEFASFLEKSAKEQSNSTDSSSSTMNTTESPLKTPITKYKNSERRSMALNTPLRYSSQFEKEIRENLSSTICQQDLCKNSTNKEYDDIKHCTDDSDVQILEKRTTPIELSSTDDELATEENKENIVSKPSSGAKLMQPKIPFAFKQDASNNSSTRNVSQDYYSSEVRKLKELKYELANAETLLGKLAKNLPDSGYQLEKRIQELRNDVEAKTKVISGLVVGDKTDDSKPSVVLGFGSLGTTKDTSSEKFQQLQEERKATFSKNVPDWEELSAAVNEIKPIHTGRQGMQTFQNQKALTVDRLKDLHGSLETCPTEDVLADDPKGLKVSLMDHQKHALAWMNWREQQRPRGGILADDMGLGKTLTMISLVLACKNRSSEERDSDDDDDATQNERYYRGGTVVVCPASLLRQWEAETKDKVARHRLTICVHHGNNRNTRPKHLRTYDIVVTTYNIVSREHKSRGALFGIKWKRIILDEAHVIRNHKAQSSEAVCGLRGKFRWALTGTPIQNKEMDIYALLKFLRCTPFDELAHWKKWIDKSAGGQQRLNTIMKSIMLRRTKIQLQERGALMCLPEKSTKLIEVELDKDEMNVYQKIMVYSRTLFAQFLFQRAERNTDLMYASEGSRPTYMQAKDPNDAYYKMHKKFTQLHRGQKEIKSHEILVLLLRLRQICCHPGLIDAMLEDADAQSFDTDSDPEQAQIDLLEQLNKLAINDDDEHSKAARNPNSSVGDEQNDSLKGEDLVVAKASARVLQRSNPVFNLNRLSTKMAKVLATLKEAVLMQNDKAIIVSQWTSVLNILKTHLDEQRVISVSLNGSIPVHKRQDIIAEFNNPTSEKRVLLLSLTAGGVGLNLVGANHLFLIDLHWNPQLEAQAQDRIYRVGQKKNVTIYKFMCKDTVEERIKALQDHKLSLANDVLTGARTSQGSKLTIDELKSLFGL